MNEVNINAKTGLLGLLGNPVEHSVSPAIHGTLAKLLNQNFAYLAFSVEKEKLENAIKGADALKVQGMNVTVPYKKDVMAFCNALDDKAKLLGAVNTLVRTKNGYKGYNTDMPGLQRAMRYDGVSVKNKNVVVIGAGGVANAIMGMLLEDGAANILILNRSRENALQLAQRFRQAYGANHIFVSTYTEDYLSRMGKIGQDDWVAFQASSVGMAPNVDDCAIENKEFYKKISVGYDMIFNPYETRFMKLVKEGGGNAWNGLRMLLFQGIQAFELWTGEVVTDAQAEIVLQVLKEELGIRE
ncbi:MAG: shikimate dehydrogenase [Lachnospiraceae bacterium]